MKMYEIIYIFILIKINFIFQIFCLKDSLYIIYTIYSTVMMRGPMINSWLIVNNS